MRGGRLPAGRLPGGARGGEVRRTGGADDALAPGAEKAVQERIAAERGAGEASRTATPLAVGAAVLSAACFGLGTVMSEAVLARVPPFTLLPLQLAASVAFLGVVVLWQGIRLPRRREDLKPALTGILEPGLAYTAGVVGLALTTASNATLVGSTETVVTIFLAWLLLRERVGLRLVALALVAVAGVLLVTVPDAGSAAGEGSLSGDLLVFVGVLFAALYAVANRRHVAGVEPPLLAAMQHSVGLAWSLAALAAVLLLGAGGLGLAGLGPGALAMALASGVVQYALPFWLYLFALRSMTVSVLSFYLSLIPVFGVAGAHLFLGERLAPSQLFGGLLIVAAISATSLLRR